MSGGNVPYHLRQNKSVDRFAFIELLHRLDRVFNIRDYTYVGFGGHTLEDFKYIHSQFDLRKMISLESDQSVYARQIFNRPVKCIDCRFETSGEFVNRFSNGAVKGRVIVWLDYTTPRQILAQLEEFSVLLGNAVRGDVIKVTLNANPDALVDAQVVAQTNASQDVRSLRKAELADRIGGAYLVRVPEELFDLRGYPKVLMSVLEQTAEMALAGRPEVFFQPLASFSYSDGTQMLTVTGIIVDRDEDLKRLWSVTRLRDWPLATKTWTALTRISIPNFTLKERLEVERQLPGTKAEGILRSLSVRKGNKRLQMLFSKDEKTSLELLRTYALFYRHSLHFTKMLT